MVHEVVAVAGSSHGGSDGNVDVRVARRRRARDVGDRGDVVPVEAVPKAQRHHAEQHRHETGVHGATLAGRTAGICRA